MKKWVLLVLFALSIFLVGCQPQTITVTKYQCQTGEMADSLEGCSEKECPITQCPEVKCPELDCSQCPPKVEYKDKIVYKDREVEKVKFVCSDGSVKTKSSDCVSGSVTYSLLIEPTYYVDTIWYGSEGYIKSLQFSIENNGNSRFEYYGIDLKIFKDGTLIDTIVDWSGSDTTIDKDDMEPESGSLYYPKGLRVTQKGRYTAVLQFKNSQGDVFYEHSSYFNVPSE